MGRSIGARQTGVLEFLVLFEGQREREREGEMEEEREEEESQWKEKEGRREKRVNGTGIEHKERRVVF